MHFAKETNRRRRYDLPVSQKLEKPRKIWTDDWNEKKELDMIPSNESNESNDFTITNVNQTHELNSQNVNNLCAKHKKMTDWYNIHSLEQMGLTMKNLMSKACIMKPEIDETTGQFHQCLLFKLDDLNKFQLKIEETLEMYSKKIKSYMNGNTKFFGSIKGSNVGLLVDCSFQNVSSPRRNLLIQALENLVMNQLSSKSKLFIAGYNHKLFSLWDSPVPMSQSRIDEMRSWIRSLEGSDGSDLMMGLRKMLSVRGIDTICVVVCSKPDCDVNLICDFVEQRNLMRNIDLHLVSFECFDELTNEALKNMAKDNDGCYHCFNSRVSNLNYTSSELMLLLNEVRKCQIIFTKIQELRSGKLGNALVRFSEISKETLEIERNFEENILPLRLEMPSFKQATSQNWLVRNGLRRQNLDIYQVLARNAFSYREQFVPVISKTVQSQVHENVMVQFEWHDGSIKNIHVDVPALLKYQETLGAVVGVLEKRLEWLSSGSRKLFGTVTEENVVLMLDMSKYNKKLLPQIQESLRVLLEQQIANKELFNIIVCSRSVNIWKPTMIKPTGEALQEAWRWIMCQHCSGVRNFMDGLKVAFENDEEEKKNIKLHGLYLFATGIPEQDGDLLTSYVEERCSNGSTKIHVVYFSSDDFHSNELSVKKAAVALREMSHSSEGRFHWIKGSGIVECDDMKLISDEIELALSYSKKCSSLIEAVRKKYSSITNPQSPNRLINKKSSDTVQSDTIKCSLHPKQTVLTIARQNLLSGKEKEKQDVPKALAYKNGQKFRASSALAGNVKNKTKEEKVKQFRRSKISDVKSLLYDEQISSKDWLNQFGLPSVFNDFSSQREDIKNDFNSKKSFLYLRTPSDKLKQLNDRIEVVHENCLQRLKWLFTGSRKVFGTVLERNCVIIIDISGSMIDFMDSLKLHLSSLITEQILPHCKLFNLISFSSVVKSWKTGLVMPSKENCSSALEWISNLRAGGSTCTLHALQDAMTMAEVEGVYLLTDGKPDTSMSLVREEIYNLNVKTRVIINTISFNCDDRLANSFLLSLAHENEGRFHRADVSGDVLFLLDQIVDADFTDPQEYSLMSSLEGDDVEELVRELSRCREELHEIKKHRTAFC